METRCVECDGRIVVPSDVMLGEILTCPDCGSDFEVYRVDSNQVLLKPAEAVGEDWGE